MTLPSLKFSFIFLLLFIILTTSYSIYTGEYQRLMIQAVEKAGEYPEEISKEEMTYAFIGFSLGFAVFIFSIAGFLTYKSYKQKNWAIWALTFFGLWQAYDSINGTFIIRDLYPGEVDITDWLVASIISILWIYIIFSAQLIRIKSTKNNP